MFHFKNSLTQSNKQLSMRQNLQDLHSPKKYYSYKAITNPDLQIFVSSPQMQNFQNAQSKSIKNGSQSQPESPKKTIILPSIQSGSLMFKRYYKINLTGVHTSKKQTVKEQLQLINQKNGENYFNQELQFVRQKLQLQQLLRSNKSNQITQQYRKNEDQLVKYIQGNNRKLPFFRNKKIKIKL